MTGNMNGTRIIDVEAVAVPVADQDQALQFYVSKLGLEVRRDVGMGDGDRWIQVAPPESSPTTAPGAGGS